MPLRKTSHETALVRELSLPVPDDGAGPVLHAVVYVPREAAAGARRAPLAVCAHGLGESGLRVAPVARALAGRGMVAVCPSLRGGGGPTAGETTAMSVLTQVADLEAVLTAAAGWPFVEPGRSVLFGRSQGGLVAALTAARRPASVSALALWYPALGIPQAVRARFTGRARVPESFSRRVEGRELRLGRRYALDAWDLDVPGILAGLRVPALVVHGDQDRDVPLALSREAVRRLPDARLVPIAGAGHGFDGEHLEAALGAVTEFLSWNGLLETAPCQPR